MPPWGRKKLPTPQILTWLCVQPTRIEEFRGEVDVDITEKEKDVASLPEAGSNIESFSPGKFSIQLDEGKVPEVGGSKRKTRHSHPCSRASQAYRIPRQICDQGPSKSRHVSFVTLRPLRLPSIYRMIQTHRTLVGIKGPKNKHPSEVLTPVYFLLL